MLTAPRSRAVTACALAILVAVAAAAALLGVAMHLYPGGTAIDRGSAGHSFWLNFLCDLTGDVAVNGRPNRMGASAARGAVLALAVAVGCFWIVLPRSFRARSPLAVPITGLGLLSVVGLAVVPLVTGPLHVVALLVSAVPALTAGIMGLFETIKRSGGQTLAALGGGALGAAAIDAVLYARSYMVHPRVVPPALPALQRITLLLTLAWMLGVAIRALRRRAKACTITV